MTTFLVELLPWGAARVSEIAYRKRGGTWLTGVSLVRDVVGYSLGVPSRVAVSGTSESLVEALALASAHVALAEKALAAVRTELRYAQRVALGEAQP